MAAALVVVIGQNSIPESFGRLTGYLTRLARVLCFMGHGHWLKLDLKTYCRLLVISRGEHLLIGQALAINVLLCSRF